MGRQARGGEVVDAGLQAGLGAAAGLEQPAPQVEFPARIGRQRHRVARPLAAVERARRIRVAAARARQPDRQGREQRTAACVDHGAGIRHLRHRGFQVLVADDQALRKVVQHRVLEQRPPVVGHLGCIALRGLLPRTGLLVLRRCWRRRRRIDMGDGAGREHEADGQRQNTVAQAMGHGRAGTLGATGMAGMLARRVLRQRSRSISTNTTGVVYSVSSWLKIKPPTIAMPSGWRSSAPSPVPSASGTAPKMAASVVIRIGRRRRLAARKIAGAAVTPLLRSPSIAKSIIMIAFFLTMPISRITPINAMMENSVLNSISASSAPTPADGSVDKIVIGCTRLSYSMPST